MTKTEAQEIAITLVTITGQDDVYETANSAIGAIKWFRETYPKIDKEMQLFDDAGD
jgi:hypothetical protein